ncbi:MAG: hypothetical protein Q8M73_00260 [Actinomycetota bacterium]|nr:hypothetical protein [Actinomycetota bacterium]
MTVLIRDAAGGWREPAEHGYESEASLQQILFEHPSLVPGVEGATVACREFRSVAGFADVIVLDSEGALTLVECKLASNAEVRREVIGQVLDYAARLWRMPVQEFERAWINADPNSQSPFTVLGDDDGRIRTALQDNLHAGRLNLVLAVDHLNDDLKRIVEFLNTITASTTGVIVVEFARMRDGQTEILIPSAYGMELVEAKSAESRATRPSWTVDAYSQWCALNNPEGLPAVTALISQMQSLGFDVQGGRAATPSLNSGLDIPGLGRKYPICMYTDPNRGALIEVRFSDFKNTLMLAQALADAIEGIPNIPIPVPAVRESGYTRRPNIPASQFTPSAAIDVATAVRTALLRPWDEELP